MQPRRDFRSMQSLLPSFGRRCPFIDPWLWFLVTIASIRHGGASYASVALINSSSAVTAALHSLLYHSCWLHLNLSLAKLLKFWPHAWLIALWYSSAKGNGCFDCFGLCIKHNHFPDLTSSFLHVFWRSAGRVNRFGPISIELNDHVVFKYLLFIMRDEVIYA